MSYIVYQGSQGWGHEGWAGDFYPVDLPDDWQLPFYNTQFRCVYLPYALWRNAGDEDVACWLHETRNEFRFVLQAPACPDARDVASAARFGERGMPEAGADIVWVKGEPDLRKLAQRMQAAAQSGVPLYVISQDASLPQLRKITELMDVLGV